MATAEKTARIRTSVKLLEDDKGAKGDVRNRKFAVLNRETGDVLGHVFEIWQGKAVDSKGTNRTSVTTDRTGDAQFKTRALAAAAVRKA